MRQGRMVTLHYEDNLEILRRIGVLLFRREYAEIPDDADNRDSKR
jgi:hypothetical protein